MANIFCLTKKGTVIKTVVLESVSRIWELMNEWGSPSGGSSVNRDFIYLTDVDGKKMIYNKRFVTSVKHNSKDKEGDDVLKY